MKLKTGEILGRGHYKHMKILTSEADFLVENGMFICIKIRIFIQINMPFYARTACFLLYKDAHLL